MKNVSNEYKTIAESLDGSARYYHQILVDGVELTDTIVEFKYSHTCNNSTNFSVGNTASAIVEFKIDEPSINLENKEIQVNQGLKLANGNMEYVKLGKFKVLSPEIERFQANYQCVDAMTYKMATVYESALTYPTTDIAILEEICQQAGIELVNDNLVAHTIDKKLDNYTKREIIGFISQLQGKNAIINTDGKLELIWYAQTDYVVDDNRIYSDRIDIVKNSSNYVLGYIKSTYGSKELVAGDVNAQGIKITNPYMTQEILNEVFDKIKNFTFRSLELDFYGDFRLEVGDIVTVNTNNESYIVPVMALEQSSDGGVITTIESVGETATQNSVDTNGSILNEIKRSVVNSETARTIAEQSADKINFIVEGDSVSEFTISDKALNIISENIDLTGKVTFNSFDKETQETLSNISEPIKEAEGSPILLTDSAESNLIDFKAYGRSTQDGTPTPDAPVDIVSVGESSTLEVKSTGKNLLPYPYIDTTKTVNGIIFTDNGDGSITMNGTATADSIFLLGPVSLKAGTYTLSVNDSGFNSNYCNFQLSNSEKNLWWGIKNVTSSTGVNTYTLNEDLLFNYNRLIVKSGHTMDNVTWKPMVRRTEITDDTYKPYKSSSISIPLAEPLRSVGEVKDEIACVDGVYGVIRRIGTKLIDGVNVKCTLVNTSNYADKGIVQLNLGSSIDWNDSAEINNSTLFMCDKFSHMTNGVEVNTGYKVINSSKVFVAFISSELGITNTTEANTWLKSNNILVQYILAEEVFEPFTDQTPFYNIATFDSVTYITATDNAEMKVEYFRNTSTGQQLSNANSNANDAINKANEVMTQVNKTVKSITMHYLATTASSGVTTSTSGWTTTAQQISATKKYLWTYQTMTYADGTTTDTTPVISGVYGATGATGTGISKVVPLYYLKSNTTAPSAPTSAVTSTSTASGVWTKSVPTYVNNYTYFTCTQTQYTNSTYGWSTVVVDNALTNANNNATNALNKANSVDSTLSSLCILEDNKTVIDGSKIYTGSVTAKQINVKDLFAQDINAAGTITGVKLYGATGEFEGDIASYGTVTLYTGAINSDGKFVKDAGKIVLKATNRKNSASDDVIDVLLTFSSHIDDNNKTVLFLDNKNKLLLQHGDSNGDGSAIIQFGYDADASMGGTHYYEGGTKLLTKSEFAYKTLPGDTYNYEYIASPHIERLMVDKLAATFAYLEKIISTSDITTPLIMIKNIVTALADGEVQNMLGVQYKDASENTFTTYPIRVVGSTQTNPYNAAILLGSNNGTTIVGAGESSGKMPAAIGAYNNENLYFFADGKLEIYTGCSNDAATYKKALVIGTDGNAVFINKVTAVTFDGTATKVQGNYVNPTNKETWYAIPFYSGGNTTGSKALSSNEGCSIGIYVGTSETEGRMTIVLGNKKTTGEADNMRGCLRLYDKNANYANLYFGNGDTTASRNIYLPNANGTLALNTEASPSADGLMSSADKTKMNAIGTYLSTAPDGVSFAAQSGSTGTKLASLKLPAGTYVVTCAAHFPTSSSASVLGTYRRATLDTTSGKINASRGYSAIAVPIYGQTTMLQISNIIVVSSETTYYLNGQTDSQEPEVITGMIKAVRIA